MEALSEQEITQEAGRIGGATLLSRVLGLARDMVFAALFGTSYVADAFNLAFLLPNTLRLAVGEGAVRSCFVPVYTETLQRSGLDRARQLAGRIVALWAVTLGGVSAIGVLVAGPVVHLYASGWSGMPEVMDLAVGLTRLLFPFIAFAGITALLGGVLNAHHCYGVPALAPVVLNACMIATGLFICPRFAGAMDRAAWAFAVGTLVGGLAEILVHIPSLRRVGFQARHRPAVRDQEVRRMGRLLVPAVLGLGVFQVNTLVDSLLATHLGEGSVTALRLANRVMLLPLGVFGIAVTTAALPTLSSMAAADEKEKLRSTIGFTLRMIFAVMAPATLALVLLAQPVVRLLFERGAFVAGLSTPLTAGVLLFYALGLPAFGAVKALAQAFYALQDTRTPFTVAVVAMVANIVLNLLLMGPLGAGGLALATSLSGCLNFFLLSRTLRRRLGGLEVGDLLRSAGRILVLSGVAVVAGRLLHDRLLGSASGATAELLPVAAAAATAGVIYFGGAKVVRAEEVVTLRDSLLRLALRRGRGRTPR